MTGAVEKERQIKKREIFSQIKNYTGASFFTQVVSLAAAVATRKFLGPFQMGVWSLIQVIMTYATYTTCGTTNATAREIPYHLGRQDYKKADEIKNIVFSFSMLTAFLVGAGMIMYAFWYKNFLRAEIFFGLIFGSTLIVLERFNNILISLLRAYKHFKLAGNQMILSSLVNAGLVAFFAYRYAIYGFMWAMFLSFVFNAVYIYAYQRFSFRWQLDWKEIWNLILYGMPLMILGVLDTLLLTIDKIMIARFMGLEALGLYSIAVLASKYVYSFPNAIGVVMIPNFQEQYGKSHNLADLEIYMAKWALLFCNGMPVLIALGWFCTPFLVHWLLPEYAAGIVALKYLMISAYFLALIHPYSDFLITIKQHFKLFPIVLGTCATAVAFNLVVVKLGWGLEGFSIATTAALFIKFTACFFFSGRCVYKTREIFVRYMIILLKFSYMIGLIYLIQTFVPVKDHLAAAILKSGIFIVGFAPLLLELEKKFGILQLVNQKKVLSP